MDVICLGELLIDFIAEKAGCLEEVQTFNKFPGGAAGNIAVGVKKLGLKSGVISKVGKDPFGDFLIKTLASYNVDISQIHQDEKRKTGLAFVSLDKEGVPNYQFYRDLSASMLLSPEEVKEDYIKQGRALYFSSISLVNEPFRSANYQAIQFANKHSLIVAFDPNIRISLWESEEEARREIKKVIGYIDVLKINKDELFFLESRGKAEDLCTRLFKDNPNLKLIALTLGKEGALLMNSQGESVWAKGLNVKVADTTGAGDAFTSALLSRLLKAKNLQEIELAQLGHYANTAASLIIQKPGVIFAMPTGMEIEAFLKQSV